MKSTNTVTFRSYEEIRDAFFISVRAENKLSSMKWDCFNQLAPIGFPFSIFNQLLETPPFVILISCNLSRISLIGDVPAWQV